MGRRRGRKYRGHGLDGQGRAAPTFAELMARDAQMEQKHRRFFLMLIPSLVVVVVLSLGFIIGNLRSALSVQTRGNLLHRATPQFEAMNTLFSEQQAEAAEEVGTSIKELQRALEETRQQNSSDTNAGANQATGTPESAPAQS